MIPLAATYVIAALAAVLMGVCASFPLARIIEGEWKRSSRHARRAFLALAVGLSLYAGAKHGSVKYPYTDVETRYLFDAGSYVTNDYVHVSFTLSQIVPSNADLLGYVRPAGSTNDEEWVQLLETTFGQFACPSNIPYVGAETNDFQFFTTWTPGPVVHTNGVANINWQKASDGSTNRFSTIRTGIYVDGNQLSPNPELTNGPPVVLMFMSVSPSSTNNNGVINRE